MKHPKHLPTPPGGHPHERLHRFVARSWRYSRRAFVAFVILILLLAAARLAAPSVLKAQINKRLAVLPDYIGRVEGVDLGLLRGAYALRGVEVKKRAPEGPGEPFFSARRIDFSIAWRELFQRRIVSDIVLEGPRLTFVRAGTPEESQLAADRQWQQVVQDLFPIDITFLQIKDGHVRFIDRTVFPEVDVFVTKMNAEATGLRNRPDEGGKTLPASINLDGDTVGQGRLVAHADAALLEAKPTFEMQATLENVHLPDLNRFLVAYGKVDVSAGDLKMYLEAAGKEGRFEGYVKPFLTDVSFKDVQGEKKNALEHVWELIVGAVVKLVKNKETDQVAARMPFAGEFGSTEIGVMATVRTLLRHGFVRALPAALENSVKTENVPPPGEPLKPPAEKK